MMRIGDMPCQGKAQASSLGLACDERVEQVLVQEARRTGARIAYVDDQLMVLCRQVQTHATAGPGGLNGIQTKVENRSAQTRLIDGRGDLREASADDELDTAVLRRRLDERGNIVNQTNEVALAVRPLFMPAEREQAAHLLLDERELAEGHVQARVSTHCATPCAMELEAQTCAGDCVAQLVSHPRGELGEQACSFGLSDRLSHLVKLGAHEVDRPLQVLNLIIVLACLQCAEITLGDPSHLVLEAVDATAQPVRRPCGRRRREHKRGRPKNQGRLGRLPPSFPPA